MKYFSGRNKNVQVKKVETKDRIESIIWATIVTALVFIWKFID